MDSSAKYFVLVLVTQLKLLGQCVTFVLQPHDTNAVVGENVFFPCTYFGTREVPHWLVNCTSTHTVSTLPSGHSHNGTGLTVHNVDISMNGSKYQCCFEVYVGGGVFNETCSSIGRLIISAVVAPSRVSSAPAPSFVSSTSTIAYTATDVNLYITNGTNINPTSGVDNSAVIIVLTFAGIIIAGLMCVLVLCTCAVCCLAWINVT